MDHQSILDQSLASSAMQGTMPGTSAPRSSPPSVSAGIATASAHHAKSAEGGPRFPAEDGGRSLAAMACRDLDAALQLLAERAQYITGASGAMIALRRGDHNDMLCRASAGSNAPELGALLSMEYGFSGESVRTRQALRCDDAERDARVNREGCRQLGIASVVVMPVVSDQQVLGVFELFSGKPHAFDQRDLSALQRLSEMVETAVKYAVAAQTVSAIQDRGAVEEFHPPVDEIKLEVETDDDILATEDLRSAPTATGLLPSKPEKTEPEKTDLSPTEVLTTEAGDAEPTTAAEPRPKKPLFWSAAMQTAANASPTADSSSVPTVLRNLHKCQACGFPVSQGRAFCVECEEKQWRGQRLPQTSASVPQQAQSLIENAPGIPALRNPPSPQIAATQTAAKTKESISGPSANTIPVAATTDMSKTLASAPIKSPAFAAITSEVSGSPIPNLPQPASQNLPLDASGPGNSVPFFSSAVQPESWLSANRYILGALIVVAMVLAAIAWLH
jgi:hypothetical protein